MFEDRIKRLRENMAGWGVDGLVVISMENVRYLSGFTGSAGAVLISEGAGFLVTDSRYTTQAGEEVKTLEIVINRDKYAGLKEAASRACILRLGFETNILSYGGYLELKAGLPNVELVPLKKELDWLRVIKDEEELKKIKAAIGIASQAFEEVVKAIGPGVKEREVALALERAMRERGGEKLSFDIIVASGYRGALPHGIASDKAIESGELVVVDFGIRYQGYYSDETHTLAVGSPDARDAEIHSIVKLAHDAAIREVRPGVPFTEIDGAARRVIEEAGCGDYFGHGTGHGIGLAVHEAPWVAPGRDGAAAEGMTFTIEPGIYLPGRVGVRLEDVILVTRDGCQVLNPLSKELRIL